MTAPVHTVSGYAGLVSVTVQSLGFVPEQSLVMVCLADSSRLGPIGRIDLPGPVGDSEAFAAAVGDLVAVADRHADAVVLVLFSTDPFQRAAVVEQVSYRFAGRIYPVAAVLWVDGHRFGNYLDQAAGTGTWNLNRDLPDALRLTSNRRVLPDRRAVAATIKHTHAVPGRSFRTAATAADRLTPVRRIACARTLLGQAVGTARHGGRLPADVAAELAVLLGHPEVADDLIPTALTATAADADEQAATINAMVSLTADTPDRWVPGPALLLAILAYTAGDGALANVAVDRVLSAAAPDSPARRIGDLLVASIQAGIHPAAIRAALTETQSP
jgi:hypothetical protein